MPVATPSSSHKLTTPSVGMLPVPPDMIGHPPSPPNDASNVSIPHSSAATTLARPSPQVFLKYAALREKSRLGSGASERPEGRGR